jgi:outer membrane protein assembly factor BamB
MTRALFFLVLAAVVTAGAVSSATGPTDWPQFRGAGAAGVADASTLPVEWSATKNVAWMAEIDGRGWSSPIVWGGRVFVTSAVSAGDFKEPSTGIYGNDYVAELQKQGLPPAEINRRVIARDIEQTDEVEAVRWMVMALDARTGKVVWEREAHKGRPFGGRHRKNTYASETPATDGERVYASFGGNVGLFAYTLDGTLVWKHTWEPQPIYLDFGTASSPVVHNGRVYQLHDTEGESFLSALDARTGTVLWTLNRTVLEAKMKSGWATPFIWETPARTEIVTIGKGMAVSYGPDGKELWRLQGMTQATPSPVAGGGLLYVGSGSQGEANRPIYAIKPGATGDISLAVGETSNASVAWFQPRASAYTGSPLYYRGKLYAINDNGVMQVFNATTGAEIYKARVGGVGNTFSASPVASNGRVYALSEDGDTFVFGIGDTYEELSKNSLGEMSLASPAVDATGFFIRTQKKLFRVAAPPGV